MNSALSDRTKQWRQRGDTEKVRNSQDTPPDSSFKKKENLIYKVKHELLRRVKLVNAFSNVLWNCCTNARKSLCRYSLCSVGPCCSTH